MNEDYIPNFPTRREIDQLVEFRYNHFAGRWRVFRVKGDVLGNVEGDISGSVVGTVGGTICGKKWQYTKTLKERIQDALKAGDTDLAAKLLEKANVSEA